MIMNEIDLYLFSTSRESTTKLVLIDSVTIADVVLKINKQTQKKTLFIEEKKLH